MYNDANAEAAGYIMLEPSDGADQWYWTDDSSRFLASTTVGNVGTATGTLIGPDPSDERLKSNIKPISYGINELMQLEPVEFDMFKEHMLGFVAQRTQLVLPETVYDTGDYLDGPKYNDPTEISKEDALELVDVVKLVQKTKKVKGEDVKLTKTSNRLNKKTGEIEEHEKPDTKKVTTQEYQLKANVTFDEDTGKYYLTTEVDQPKNKLAMKQIQILAVAVKAIQEQQAMIDGQGQMIQKQQEEIELLKAA